MELLPLGHLLGLVGTKELQEVTAETQVWHLLRDEDWTGHHGGGEERLGKRQVQPSQDGPGVSGREGLGMLCCLQ